MSLINTITYSGGWQWTGSDDFGNTAPSPSVQFQWSGGGSWAAGGPFNDPRWGSAFGARVGDYFIATPSVSGSGGDPGQFANISGNDFTAIGSWMAGTTYRATITQQAGSYVFVWMEESAMAPCFALRSILSVRLPDDVFIKNNNHRENDWVNVSESESPLLLTYDHLVKESEKSEPMEARDYTDRWTHDTDDVVDLVSQDGRFIEIKGVCVKTSKY